MREELRRSQDRMTEACEQRMEALTEFWEQRIDTLEERMDTVVRKMSKKVIFSARKTSGSNFNGPITFDTIDVNIGGGMHSNGKFIAPESGTYGFTFSALTGSGKSHTFANVYKDGNFQNYIYDGNSAGNHNNINSSWMMKLAKGQVVHLEVEFGKLYATLQNLVIFTGNLLMLDE